VRVVESGSFSAVAQEAGSSQGAISKQVAALERELGVSLLTRTTRSLALTESGGRYFEQARRLVAEIEEAEVELRQGELELRGWLRIAASVGFGRMKLMPLVRRFMAKHPQIRVDLRLHDGFIDLVEQGIDVAVRIGEQVDSGLVARRVGTSQRMLLAHRDYLRGLPTALPPLRHPDDLAQHNCLIYTGMANRNLWSFTAGPTAQEPAGTIKAVRVEGNLQTNSSEVMRAAVLAGMGIGNSPSWLFEQELASGEVERLMPDWMAPDTPIQLVFPPERRHSAKLRAFSEFVAPALHSQLS